MQFSPLIDDLVQALRCLPGVGQKTAQRMAFYLLVRDRLGAQQLAELLQRAMREVVHCHSCRNLSETSVCALCASPQRDDALLCIVENPLDVVLVERATGFKGKYFVLMGHLSPLDGIGPKDLGLDLLGSRLDSGKIREVIVATNPTVEGEATAHYIADMVRKRQLTPTRIAHGVPLGGELEYVDNSTLSQAFSDRREFH